MLKPKQIKFLKQHRGRKTGKLSSKIKKNFGDFTLEAQEAFWLTAKQIEATRRTIMRAIKKEGKLWTIIFPHKPITMRTVESRMGAGKGSVSHWVAVIKPGTRLFEISGVSQIVIKKAFKAAAQKLPIKTKIICNIKN